MAAMTKLHPQSLAYAVSDEEIENKLRELISVAQVPEPDRGAWYASVTRYSRESHESGFYDLAKAAGIFRQLAHAYWPNWPPQED